ncbi:MAG: sugar phosphate isomerase/epimerase [Oscillospiraceae bacterium]|jgi:sugar phosphate isomerase/epimerase|nr:sugar phosphate isomerase/epimerase [Oscillospiraceae bacterium]
MKIHSVAWGWTLTPEDMPEGGSLLDIADSVKSLGFDGVDYLSTRESLDEYFTAENCKKIKDHLDGIGLDAGGFVFQSDEWNNPDAAANGLQLAYFAKCAEAASRIGAPIISCIIPHPFGAKPTRGNASPSEKQAFNLPKGYDFQADWDRFAAGLARACDIAADHGITIALECFPKSLCSTPHAMIRIVKDVNRPNFGIQLDTAHLMNQRLDVETAIYQLGKDRIKHLHCKDSDGLTRGNLPAGSGLVDYTRVFDALSDIGYEGRASVEVEFTDNPARYMRQALDHLKLCLAHKY